MQCAAEILHTDLVDEVWIVPCGARPDKPSLKTSVMDRLVMCHLAVNTTFGSSFKVKVCDEEMHHPRAMPSLVLLNFLEARHPLYEFKFVIGTDLIEQLRSWDAQGCPGAWDEIPDAGDIIFETKEFIGKPSYY